MSGSSLDGLDIVYVHLEEVRGKWAFDIKYADCVPYTQEWIEKLQHAQQLPVPEFLKLNTSYGKYLSDQVNRFIEDNNIHHQVHFIASHGHTVFHDPANHTTYQIGDGATIAAITSLPVINDLRALDVALGGQGAPIVPIGDSLFFSDFDYLLNIGGIANLTVQTKDTVVAFDVCPANQVLNILAQKEGKDYDAEGAMAESGKILPDVLTELNGQHYYALQTPKSLSNEAAQELVFPTLLESLHLTEDLLHTMVLHIAEQVANAVRQHPSGKEQSHMLVTGGGAFNTFLVMQLQKAVFPLDVTLHIPDPLIIKFKEALVMALIGALRWREETNVLSSVTGASRNSISGAVWMGHSYNAE